MSRTIVECKKTPFFKQHKQAGARLVEYAGWALPLEYTGGLKEVGQVRRECGIFDVSHMGELKIKGPDALPLLQYLTSNDVALLPQNFSQYNLFINEEGGVIDDCIISHLAQGYLCVVNALNAQKVYEWLKRHARGEVDVIDESQSTALLSLQGPLSASIIEKVWGEVSSLRYLECTEAQKEGRKIFFSRSGYTGEDGFELYCASSESAFLWDMITKEAGDTLALCGLAARDILRIEAGYPLYGHEIDETIDPFSAGLGWAVKLHKHFIGRDCLAAKKREGGEKRRVAFILEERAIARQGYPIFCKGERVGLVSSGTYSPTLGKSIGMGFVEAACAQKQTGIQIEIREKLYHATVTSFPFIKIKTKK